MVKNLSAVRETWVWPLGWEDPLEKGMATHSSILAWRTPWIEYPGGLLRHDWVTDTFTASTSLYIASLNLIHPCVCMYLCWVHGCSDASVVSISLQPCGLQPARIFCLQARILEWLAMLPSRGSPDPGTEPPVPASALQVDSVPTEPPRKHCLDVFFLCMLSCSVIPDSGQPHGL